jgi:uncharacterized protein
MASWKWVVLALLGEVWIVGGHYYLWTRFLRDVGLAAATRPALPWTLAALALGIPLSVVLGRFTRPEWSVWWLTPVYTWIGVSFLLVLSAVALDALTWVWTFISFGPEGPDVERRQTLARLGALVAGTLGVGASAWALREGYRTQVKLVEVRLKKLPPALDGLRVVQLSDMHVGPLLGRDFVDEVVHRVNALAADLVVITGDLVDGSVDELSERVAPLARLTSTHGTFFVTGNHEYPVDAPAWCEHLASLGIRVLRNEYVALEQEGHFLYLAGIDDYEAVHFDCGHKPDLKRAVEGRDTRAALILLAHQPRAIHEATQHGVDLQLSGHTHGGQLWPLGSLLGADQPLVGGLGRFGETLLYVSCGTGFSGPPMRLGAPAEITHITLRSA